MDFNNLMEDLFLGLPVNKDMTPEEVAEYLRQKAEQEELQKQREAPLRFYLGEHGEARLGLNPDFGTQSDVAPQPTTAKDRAMAQIAQMLSQQPLPPGPEMEEVVSGNWRQSRPQKMGPTSYDMEGGSISVPGGREGEARMAAQAAVMGNKPAPSDILRAAGAQSKFRTPSPQEVADATLDPNLQGPSMMGEQPLYGGRSPESMMRSYGWMEDAFPAERPQDPREILMRAAQTRPQYIRSPEGGGVIRRGMDQEGLTAIDYLTKMDQQLREEELIKQGYAKDILVADMYGQGRMSGQDPMRSTTGINNLADGLIASVLQDTTLTPEQQRAAQQEILSVLYSGTEEEKMELLRKYGRGMGGGSPELGGGNLGGGTQSWIAAHNPTGG